MRILVANVESGAHGDRDTLESEMARSHRSAS